MTIQELEIGPAAATGPSEENPCNSRLKISHVCLFETG